MEDEIVRSSSDSGDRGSTVIIAAGLLALLLAFTAGAVDIGMLTLQRRQLQSATDAAALAAALAPSRATAIAGQALASNGFSATQLVSATAGQYVENAQVAASQRFTPTNTGANAVEVQTTLQAPIYFLRTLLPQSSFAISANAIGTRIDQAGFTAGTGLAAINGGVANAVLGSMLGTTVSLSAVSYQGLLDTNIGAADFLNALAARLGIPAGSYDQVLASSVTVPTIVAAEIAALQGEGTAGEAADALDGLQSLASSISSGGSFTVGNLIGFGPAGGQQVATAAPGTAGTATLNLYQLAALSAQLANGSHAVTANGVLSIPGIATADLVMTAIEPAQPAAPYFEVGPVGTSVHTAQVRLLLTIKLLGALSFLGNSALVTLPVYLELGSGNATLTGISCGAQPATDTSVTISAQPSAATLYVAQITPSVMTDFTQPVPTGTPATLVNLAGIVSVTGSATLAVGSGNPTNLTFSQAQMTATPPQSQTVASSGMSQNLVDTLGNSLQLQVTALGLPLLPAVTQQLKTALTGLVAPVFASLDTLIDPVLAALGVQVGYITVTASGAQCGLPVLVL